jgi:hypothetical protein
MTRVSYTANAEGRIPKSPDFAEGKSLVQTLRKEPGVKESLLSKRASRRQGSPALAHESSAKVGDKRRTKRPANAMKKSKKVSTDPLMIIFFRSKRQNEHFL